MKKLTIALIGLGFGSTFGAIYADHPNVEKLVVVDNTKERVDEFMELVGNNPKVSAYGSFEDVLSDSGIDAVHVCTGIDSHAALTVRALKAGKHCACAVPMATSLEDIKAIVDAARESGKNI